MYINPFSTIIINYLKNKFAKYINFFLIIAKIFSEVLYKYYENTCFKHGNNPIKKYTT